MKITKRIIIIQHLLNQRHKSAHRLNIIRCDNRKALGVKKMNIHEWAVTMFPYNVTRTQKQIVQKCTNKKYVFWS